MIRQAELRDKIMVTEYVVKKLNISMKEANSKISKQIKSGLPLFLKDEKDIRGICWVEKITINDKKVKKLSFLFDDWRLAEDMIKYLRWQLNGEYITDLPKHDTLNRTLNKNGFRFTHIADNKNHYIYRFEKRTFKNYKSEDYEV